MYVYIQYILDVDWDVYNVHVGFIPLIFTHTFSKCPPTIVAIY